MKSKKRIRPRNRISRWLLMIAAIPIVGFLLVIFIIGISLTQAYIDPPESVIAQHFLNALINADEEQATSYLSETLAIKVSEECPNGVVVACAKTVISPSWGSHQRTYFVLGSGSQNAILLDTSWTDYPTSIAIVILMTEENNKWRVRGWRGFVPFESENAASRLLYGSRTDNQFLAD